ncbi:LysR family transcriptional regulator [Pseudomonas putida]|nr:LysR family transcriptional regulator [Pseudomonas putida]WPK03249.1 LysR family transcriptional regulator [Pseudomonas putida]
MGRCVLNLLQLDLASLRLLVLAANSQNLTKAADGAHMTVSAASKRLAELERVTDCTLFIRLPRGLQLTPAGRGPGRTCSVNPRRCRTYGT